MHLVDLLILSVYFLGMLAVGVYFQRRQTGLDEYFVGGRQMSASHIGLSVVATDVGGGFSIGLGGLGFVMGLSASWLLFTGLVGAWMAAVLLVPKVKTLGEANRFRSFPDFLGLRYGNSTRLVAALVSAVGYAGFTGSQLLAGGKLAAASFELNITTAVLVMSVVIVVYTALGGLQAVVYTDTLQWGILFVGLIFLGLPLGYNAAGGWQGLRAALPAEYFSLTNVSWLQVATWMVTIMPIWFVAMTLHQRIHASKDVQTAKRAWYLAGLLEYPAMAFMGASLGMFARVLYPDGDPEMGLPLLIRDVMPVGVCGLVLAAYFAAIMSTADSCLLASVGNVVDDILGRGAKKRFSEKSLLVLSRWMTLVIGFGSVAFALVVPQVIDSILLAYSFMVAGLFLPTLGALFWRRVSGIAAFWSIIAGGGTTVVLNLIWEKPEIDPVFYGMGLSGLVLVALTILCPRHGSESEEGPKYLKTERTQSGTYEVYEGTDAESAREFLSTKRIDKQQYYVVVETPEGNWGMDIKGLYLERLLPWQKDLSSAECQGQTTTMPDMFGLQMAARGINDNFIIRVQCGKCEHEWMDGVAYQAETVVRCPSCRALNKVDTSNFNVVLI